MKPGRGFGALAGWNAGLVVLFVALAVTGPLSAHVVNVAGLAVLAAGSAVIAARYGAAAILGARAADRAGKLPPLPNPERYTAPSPSWPPGEHTMFRGDDLPAYRGPNDGVW